jgi:MYXO-CTERM domain-containing protein
MARSDAFLVTTDTLSWQQYADSDQLTLYMAAYNANSGDMRADIIPAAQLNGFTSESMGVGSACGERVELELEVAPLSDWQVDAIVVTTIWDDFELTGTACPDFVDNDGDAWCLAGMDLNNDGDCADAGEADATLIDCNDANEDINPGAPDIGGNGIDENCDGVDEEAAGTTPGPGTGTTGTTGTGTETGANGTGGDPGGTDGGDATYDDILGTGAGCACDTDSGGAGWMVIALTGLLIRRRSR